MSASKILAALAALLASGYTVATNEFSWAIWVLIGAALFDLIYAIAYHEETQLRQTLVKIGGAIIVPAAMNWFANQTAHAGAATAHILIVTTTALAALAMLRSAVPHAIGLLKKAALLTGLPKSEAAALEGDIANQLAALGARLDSALASDQAKGRTP